MRAGKEPAEDVMRRIIMACGEAGLVIHQKRTSLQRRDYGAFRVILVSASPVDLPKEEIGPIAIETIVGVDGSWPERVGVRASTHDRHLDTEGQLIDPFYKDNAFMGRRTMPVLQGMTWEEHPGVALSDLTGELMDVVKERELVRAALASGEQGPWEFARSMWKKGPIWLIAESER
jgi:hypothetical protein